MPITIKRSGHMPTPKTGLGQSAGYMAKVAACCAPDRPVTYVYPTPVAVTVKRRRIATSMEAA